MKAAVMRGVNELAIEDGVELADPGPGEVRVRLAATGVCRTDLTVLHGNFPQPMPAVLGHEGAGIVEELGAGVTGLAPGDHVVLSIAIGCGHCFQCYAGAPNLCENGMPRILGGTLLDDTCRLSKDGETLHHMFCQSSFAEYAVVPAAAAVKVRSDAPLAAIASLGCGGATGIGAVMNRAQVRAGESVFVQGVGGIGLAAVLAARAVGAFPIIASDISAEALAAASELGATHTIDASSEDVVAAVTELTQRGADHAFDLVGAAGTVETCLQSVRAGGHVTAIGNSSVTNTASVEILSLLMEKRLTGTYVGSCQPHRDIPRWVDLFMEGRLPIDRLVTRTYDLDALPEALADVERGRQGRGVIVHQ